MFLFAQSLCMEHVIFCVAMKNCYAQRGSLSQYVTPFLLLALSGKMLPDYAIRYAQKLLSIAVNPYWISLQRNVLPPALCMNDASVAQQGEARLKGKDKTI